MKNNFSKNPLWAVVFAAAAIFAASFVACANDSTTNTDWLHSYEPGDLVKWVNLDDGTYAWVEVPFLDTVPFTSATGTWVKGDHIKKSVYFAGIDGGTDTSPVAITGDTAPANLETNSVSEVLKIDLSDGSEETLYLFAGTGGKLMAVADWAAFKFKLVRTIAANKFFAGANAAAMTETPAGLDEGDVCEVLVVTPTTGAYAASYLTANEDGQLVALTDISANAVTIVRTIKADKVFAGTNALAIGTTNAPSGLDDDSISEVVVIASGAGTTMYLTAADGTLTAIGDLSAAAIFVERTLPATSFFAGANGSSTAAPLAGSPAGLTEDSLSEVLVIDDTTGTADAVPTYLAANSDGKLVATTDLSGKTLTVVTANKYSKNDYFTIE